MAKNVHIIPHMHWDREWYFTTEESRILLVNNMQEILLRLEHDDTYPFFMLDGQTAILHDYLEVRPQDKARVKALVQQGKLIIGPWYTQTDEMVVGAESISRNLLYGLKDCKEFGEPMMIGYLPDSFGQSEKMPEILNGFGITKAIFWRGSSERHGTNKHNFYWKGKHSGKVLVHLLPLGYAIGKYLPKDKQQLQKRMDKYMPVLEKGAVNDEIALPNGHDQMPIQQDIFEVMDTLKELYPDKNFFLSRFENIFEQTQKCPQLDTIEGELLDGKYMRVHRSIFSTRADLKAFNTKIENKITNILEPLMSIAYKLGFSYEHGLVESIWKDILKNHAHDSIGCCCSDKVHKQIQDRFYLADDKIDELIKFYKRRISDAVSCKKDTDKLVIFNFLTYKREDVIETQIITKLKNFDLITQNGRKLDFKISHAEEIDAGLIDRQLVHYGDYEPFMKYCISFIDEIPAMGYKAYMVQQKDEEAEIFKTTHPLKAENEFYSITVNQNATFDITDKLTGKTFTEVLSIEDGSDDGDEYDYSPIDDDFIVSSKDVHAETEIMRYAHKTAIFSRINLCIPKDLEARREKKCESVMCIELIITLKDKSDIIEISASIENQAKDHRVRLIVPNKVKSTHSVSDNQFGSIKRSVVDTAMDIWKEENWDERPDSIYPMLSYVSLDCEDTLAVITNSVREYELIGEKFSDIAITLFRSVGYLGKQDLLRRPNRPSGIKLPTPDSQLIGRLHFDLALCTNNSELELKAKQYLTNFESYNKTAYNAMKLNSANIDVPFEFSLIETSKNFVLSTLKKAEDSYGLIFRAYQSSKASVDVRFEGMEIVGQTNLNEKMINKDSCVRLENNIVRSYYLR